MKVILVTPNFHQPRGNTVTVQRIANGLEGIGIETDIISITNDTSITHLPPNDIVHGFHAYRFYLFMQQLKEKPKSYIITLTGTDLNHNLFDEDTRSDVLACLRGAEAIHVFNKEAKDIVINESPEVSDKIFIIAQGAEKFSENNLIQEKEANTFLFVLPAGIRKVKNIPFAIQVIKKLQKDNENVRLWLVGPIIEGIEGDLVKDLVQANKHWLSYLGQIPHDQMGSIYEQADCVLNTSHTEGQPSAILEAMAHELPVIVSNNQGNRSIVTNNETGFIYKTTDQFLDYASKIMNNNELRQTIGNKAKKFVEAHHSSSYEANRFMDIYKIAVSR